MIAIIFNKMENNKEMKNSKSSDNLLRIKKIIKKNNAKKKK
jgi:hypothetical protein